MWCHRNVGADIVGTFGAVYELAKYIGRVNFVRARLLVGTLVVLAAASSSAHAACTSPAGESGDLIYATNYGVMTFCNGNQWVSMAGGVSVTLGGTTGATTLHDLTDVDDTAKANGTYLMHDGTGWVANDPLGTITDTKWCVGNSSGQVVCNTDAPITVEADPQVGTLTNTKWCTTDGTAINCATDAPVTTEVDPQLDTLTADLFCQVNAGGTALVCANTAATQRTALGLDTMAIQNANAVAISGGTATLTGLTAANVTATTALSAASICDENGANCVDVSGGFSTAQGDRIVSGTAYAIVEEGSGLAVSGTLRIVTADVETCADGSPIGTIRINEATGALQICRK